MIDKYKRPRVQRTVPWRSQSTKSTAAHESVKDLARSILEKLAASTEVATKERRADWQ